MQTKSPPFVMSLVNKMSLVKTCEWLPITAAQRECQHKLAIRAKPLSPIPPVGVHPIWILYAPSDISKKTKPR